MNLIEVPNNTIGMFKKGEQNILFRYSTQPDPFADMLIYVYIGAGVILTLCVASVILSRINRKKKLRAAMDIAEDAEEKASEK